MLLQSRLANQPAGLPTGLVEEWRGLDQAVGELVHRAGRSRHLRRIVALNGVLRIRRPRGSFDVAREGAVHHMSHISLRQQAALQSGAIVQLELLLVGALFLDLLL